MFRCTSAAISPGSPGTAEDETWHAEHDLDERAGAISRPLGATLSPITRARAGDIVAVARLCARRNR